MPPVPHQVVLYAANGDSIAAARTFAELVQSAPMLVDNETDTSGMTVTIADGTSFRAMALARAMQDYLPDADRAQVIATLKAQATAHTKLAKWLNDQPANGGAE